ncbi:MAG: FAD-binding protein [Firmicutes bacterium]|nr:FAD-binding protein [Bacillota bacterium]
MSAKGYAKVTGTVVSELRRICGDRNVIFGDEQGLVPYASDESGKEYFAMPEVVVKPQDAQEVAAVLRLANEELVPVTPRGAGSGLAGGAIPLYGGIVLSTERMQRVLEIDSANMVAVVEPGVITNDLCKMVTEKDLYYAGYPMSLETSTIGGNVACNAGGGTVIKYGNTGHHVLGLEIALPSGEVLDLGGKRRKDANGYNLVQTVVGSEGTLAVITRVILNLLPAPGPRASLLAAFSTVGDAASSVSQIITALRNLPVSIEFMDRATVDAVSRFLNDRLPSQDETEAYLLVQVEGATEAEMESMYETAGETAFNAQAIEVFIMDDRPKVERVWKFRQSALEGLRAIDPTLHSEEVVVPTSFVPQVCGNIRKICAREKVVCGVHGHIGDGNLHLGIIRPEHLSPEQWKEKRRAIMAEIYESTKEYGGAISGEHGVGFVRLEFEKMMKKPAEFDLMRRLKAAFDPNGILNPGKVFPE